MRPAQRTLVVAGVVAALTALPGCDRDDPPGPASGSPGASALPAPSPSPSPSPSPETDGGTSSEVPASTSTGGGDAVAPDTGGDFEPDHDFGEGLPIEVDGQHFGGAAGGRPSPLPGGASLLLRVPDEVRARQATGCEALADTEGTVECGTVQTSSGTLAWVTEETGEFPNESVLATIWTRAEDGMWRQALTTADRALDGYDAATVQPVTLPDGTEQAVVTFLVTGTGRIVDVEIVGGAGSVVAAFTVHKGDVHVPPADPAQIEVGYPVYRPGDAEAAPSGGLASAVLRWIDGEWLVTEFGVDPEGLDAEGLDAEDADSAG